jgi:hypothetical protein
MNKQGFAKSLLNLLSRGFGRNKWHMSRVKYTYAAIGATGSTVLVLGHLSGVYDVVHKTMRDTLVQALANCQSSNGNRDIVELCKPYILSSFHISNNVFFACAY